MRRALFLLCCFLLAACGGIKQTHVAGLWWTRQVPVEMWAQLHGEDWTHPSDAYNIRSERRYHHTDYYNCRCRIVTSGTDKNQTSRTQCDTCSDSVYRDYYFYNIDRWTEHRRFTRSGDSFHAPVWPDTTDMSDCQTVVYGCERLGTPTSRYRVWVKYIEDVKGARPEIYAFDVVDSTYAKLKLGTPIALEFNWLGNIDKVIVP